MGVTLKHTISDLCQMQSLPLEVKVHMTENRLRQWVDHFGIDGVYVAFSGGKDSTVLLDIARNLYPDIQAVFVDTGLEYPEIRSFVKTYDNVEWLKPKINFRQVLDKYGYPVISKEVSQCVQGARRYLDVAAERERERETGGMTASDWGYLKITKTEFAGGGGAASQNNGNSHKGQQDSTVSGEYP